MRRPALFLALFLLSLPPLPGADPARAQELPPAEAYAVASEAVRAGDWDLAYALVDGAGPVARDLVTWSRLRAGAGTFEDFRSFLAARPDWPGLDRLIAEAERAIPAEADPATITAFFGAEAPRTGEGVARLAAALRGAGRETEAEAAVLAAWAGLGLDETGFAALLAAEGPLLAPHHAARADAMLWRGRTTDAGRLLLLLPEDDRLLAEARIALMTGARDADAKVAAVPAALLDHPGLAQARFNRMADRGDYSDATALLLSRTATPEALGEPFRWASWRATLARWAMREGRPEEAYALAVSHHLSEGEFFTDLEWLAGYLSLRHLGDAPRAATHFARVEEAAVTPITLARAAYWAGRAAEAQGDGATAAEAYGRAARHQTTFYGLLAAEKLGLPLDPALAGTEVFPPWQDAAFRSSDLALAFDMLLASGDRGSAVLFAAALAQRLDRTELAQFGAMLTDREEPWLTLLTGKSAAARGIVLPALTHPVHPMAAMDLPVAPELALAIARQESEFNATVGSPVGALGLMQLMPGTAEEVAGRLGLPYSRGRLTSDWRYNATLGSAYLATLTEMFGDSPVLIAAGYNAGPGRPRTWMTQRGDPRDPATDVIDWIEHIPFTETRNYVMRVTEAIPVYRARLSGDTGPIGFRALLEGAPPLVRPRPRPDPASTPEPEAAPGLRPVARPIR